MLIRVPPFKERGQGAEVPKSIWTGIKRDYDEYNDYYDEESEEEDIDEECESETSAEEVGGEGEASDVVNRKDVADQ